MTKTYKINKTDTPRPHPFLDDSTEVVEFADLCVSKHDLENFGAWLHAARSVVGFGFDTVCMNDRDYKTLRHHGCGVIELVHNMDQLRRGVMGWITRTQPTVAVVVVEGQAAGTTVVHRHGKPSEIEWNPCTGCAGAGRYVGLNFIEDPCEMCEGRGKVRKDV